MLTYEEIISKLSEGQKIRILTDIDELADKSMAELGIPPIKVAYLRHGQRTTFPTPTALAHSWDKELTHAVAATAAASMKAEGKNFIITPSAKIKFSPGRNEMSEDVYFSSEMASTYVDAVNAVGSVPCVGGYYLTDSDVYWMDTHPSERVINEYMVKPYADTLGKSGGLILNDSRRLGGEYVAVNDQLVEKMSSPLFSEEPIPVRSYVSAEDTVPFILRGGICIKGSAMELEAARVRYDKAYRAFQSGDATEDDLAREVAEGRAISPEDLDRAVDRLLKVAHDASRQQAAGSFGGVDELVARSTEASIVLLKNRADMLPLKNKKSVAIIGDVVNGYEIDGKSFYSRLERAIGQRGVDIRSSKGYGMENDKIEYSASRVSSVSAFSDVVLLFFGRGEAGAKQNAKNDMVALPANQLSLAESFRKMGSKVVAIVESGYTFDADFASSFSALLVAPFGTRSDADALARILFGVSSPSGRLAYTIHNDIEGYAPKHRNYKEHLGMKSGPFIGYRYYSSGRLPTAYPFGFGLSYTSFEYSELSISGNIASVSVTNTGEVESEHVVQMYVGADEPSVIRPTKELAGFVKLRIRPHETRRVAVKLTLPEVYDAERGKMVSELTDSGTYTLYVGSSSLDTPLSLSFAAGEHRLGADKEDRIDYLQTCSNIVKDKFTLEADYRFMNKSIKNLISAAVALVLAIAVGVYNASQTEAALFLNIVTALLVVASVAFFAVELFERSRQHREQRAEIDKLNEQHFEDAETVSGVSADKMFREEFDISEVEEAQESRREENEDDTFRHIDRSLTLTESGAELEALFVAHGLKIKEGEGTRLLSSIASSRVLIFNGMSSDSFAKLIMVLTEYLGTRSFIDVADESYVGVENLLFVKDAKGDTTKSNFTLAIESAENVTESIHIAALDAVDLATMSECLIPFAKYAKNPGMLTTITVSNEWGKQTTYYLPQNMWFAINLAEGHSFEDVPVFLSEVATVLSCAIESCEAVSYPSFTPRMNYYQLGYLAERAVGSLNISEDLWKKLDKVIAYVGSKAEYTVGNKQWLSVEKYISSLRSAGIGADDAMDATLAAKILPEVIALLDGKLTEGDLPMSEVLESTFGESVVNLSVDFLKSAAELRRLQLERLENERRAREEAERAERERIAAEEAERERLEAERIEAERLEAERLEQERLAAERAEAERIESERLAREAAASELSEQSAAEDAVNEAPTEPEASLNDAAQQRQAELERMAAEAARQRQAELESMAASAAQERQAELERMAAEAAQERQSELEKMAAEAARAKQAELEKLAAAAAHQQQIERAGVVAETIINGQPASAENGAANDTAGV